MNTLWQDSRYAWRVLLKRPSFTVIALATLALGIGANTAIFSAVNAVLLRPLPYRNADQLLMIWETHPVLGKVQVAYPDYRDWRAQNTAFQDLAAYTFQGLLKENLTGDAEPEQLKASLISANLFPLVGVAPMLGRNIFPEEEVPGHDQVVLLSYSLWARRFHADRSVLSRNLQLNGQSFRVVGVLPPGRAFPDWADVFLPISQLGNYDLTNRKHHQLEVVGRLKPGSTLRQAQAEMDGIAQRLQRTYPATNNTIGARLVPMREELTGDSRKPLLILLATTGLILLIACANVANLQLAHGAMRQKEAMIRAALGAGRGRLIAQLLVESTVLALAGGALGLLLAIWAAPVFRSLAPSSIQGPPPGIDGSVLAFTLVLAVLTGMLFGLLPAWKASRVDLNSGLREGRTSNESAARPGLRNALVAAEVALTIVVLVASGLLIRSFGALLHVDPGFRPDHVLTMEITLPSTKYSRLDQIVGFYRNLFLKTAALPGVEHVASISPLPFTTALSRTRFAVAGQPLPETGRFPIAQVRTVTTGYFDALKIPLRNGRYFREADMNNSFVIANESLVRRFFPDRDPIGQKILIGVVDPEPLALPIVGVVGDTREIGLNTQAEPELYFPGHSVQAALVVRTTGDPLALAAAVRQQVQQVDREQPVSQVRSMEQVLGGSLTRQRFAMLLLTLFSGLGLLLAAVGLYGVMSYSVAQRTHEMGLRLALGANRWDILRLVLKQGMGATAVGAVIGVALALVASRFLTSLLYGVSGTDPVTYIVVCGLLGAVALAAIYIPARRAIRVDALMALRWE